MQIFLNIAMAVVFLRNFDITIIPWNIQISCQLSNPFLTAENKDRRKSCKMQNFAN